MTPGQYQELWVDPKWIEEDVRFQKRPGCPEIMEFSGIEVRGTTAWGVTLNGRFDCRTSEVTYNFVAAGTGAFSRYNVRGAPHREAGRNHQHIVQTDNDVRQQLPVAVRRDDLERLTAKQMWSIICSEANITHTGEFWEPEALCE